MGIKKISELAEMNTIGNDDDLYNNIMSKSSITINDYLNYKSQVFKADKDKDGKTITNSRKNKLLNYVQGMHTDINNMRLLMATEYKLSKNDANSVANYVQSLKITTEEKTSIFKKLKGFKVNDNGTITY